MGFRAAEKTISAVYEPELAEARLSGVWVQLLGVCSGYSLYNISMYTCGLFTVKSICMYACGFLFEMLP